MPSRRILVIVVGVGALLLALVPAVVVFAAGWLPLPHIQPWGAHGAVTRSRPEVWVVFALFYLVWMCVLMVCFVWLNDRLGLHWMQPEVKPRQPRKKRLRLRAGLSFLEGQEEARAKGEAAAARAARAAAARSGGRDAAHKD